MEFRSGGIGSDGSDQQPVGPLTPPPSSSTFPTGELSLIQRICLSNPLFVASAVDDYIRPVYQQEDILLDVECGVNRGWLYLSRLSQGSRGPCIYHRGHWLTPNEFQHISGRETAKDWKRSIRHCGKSMKLLLSKGILTTHCLACECDACRSGRQRPSVSVNGQSSAPAAGIRSETEVGAGASDKHDADSVVNDWVSSASRAASGLSNLLAALPQNMEAGSSDAAVIGDSERKRENRLTSIIDQLLSNRTSKNPSDTAVSEEDNHVDNETTVPHVSLCKTPASKSARRKKAARAAVAGVKNERCSPDPEVGTESSRSDSPHSPGSSSFRTRTPSFPGTPPNPPFTPPERFSPAGFNSASGNKLIMEGIHMSRNYSDFMRSLAAKYNNSNPNEYRNGYMPAMDSRFNSYKASAASPFPLLNLPLGPLGPAVAAAAAKKDLEAAAAAAAAAATGSSSGSKKSESPTLPLSLPGLMSGLNPASLPAGLPGFPMIDMSSTQALLNIVRSASAQNAQQLETYLRGASTPTPTATKRPAESAASAASSSPLDLSASMAKRPYLEPAALESGRGFRDLFGLKSPAAEGSEGHKNPSVNGKKSPSSRASSAASLPAPPPPQSSPRSEKRIATPKSSLPIGCRLTCAADTCSPGAIQVKAWAVSDVVDFVKGIDLCAEYAEVFREHSIDGSTLPLLTEEHLITNMNMKLGPALKLRSVLAKKIGHCAVCLHCVHCHSDPAGGQQSPSRDQETGLDN